MLTSFLSAPSSRQLGIFDDDLFNHLNSRVAQVQDRSNLPNISFDVIAHENEYIIHAEVPGMKKEDIKINVDNHVLTISGEKKRRWVRNDANVRLEESNYGFFQRSIKLPKDCDADALKAKYENGVLELNCKKLTKEKTGGKSIQID